MRKLKEAGIGGCKGKEGEGGKRGGREEKRREGLTHSARVRFGFRLILWPLAESWRVAHPPKPEVKFMRVQT